MSLKSHTLGEGQVSSVKPMPLGASRMPLTSPFATDFTSVGPQILHYETSQCSERRSAESAKPRRKIGGGESKANAIGLLPPCG